MIFQSITIQAADFIFNSKLIEYVLIDSKQVHHTLILNVKQIKDVNKVKLNANPYYVYLKELVTIQ